MFRDRQRPCQFRAPHAGRQNGDPPACRHHSGRIHLGGLSERYVRGGRGAGDRSAIGPRSAAGYSCRFSSLERCIWRGEPAAGRPRGAGPRNQSRGSCAARSVRGVRGNAGQRMRRAEHSDRLAAPSPDRCGGALPRNTRSGRHNLQRLQFERSGHGLRFRTVDRGKSGSRCSGRHGWHVEADLRGFPGVGRHCRLRVRAVPAALSGSTSAKARRWLFSRG